MAQNTFFNKATVLSLAFSFTAATLFCMFGQMAWSFGILISEAWVFLNSYFLFRLVQIGLGPRINQNDKILLFSILKFPVLYLAGFFILKSRVFPVGSILIGMTLFMIAFVLAWFHENLGSLRAAEKNAT